MSSKIKRFLHLVFFFTILFNHTILSAQQKGEKPLLLIYFKNQMVERTFIEETIKELKWKDSTDEYLFDSIFVLNQLNTDIETNNKLTELMDYYINGIEFIDSPEKKALDKRIAKLLTEHNYLLWIDIVERNHLDANFTFNKVAKGTLIFETREGFPAISLVDQARHIGTRIQSGSVLKKELHTIIKRLFPMSNRAPIVHVDLDGYYETSTDRYYYANDDTIRITAKRSFDYDHSKKVLSYRWQLTKDQVAELTNPVIPLLKEEEEEITISNLDTGSYSLTTIVADGVTSTQKISKLQIIERPKISFSKSTYRKRDYQSFFQWLFNKDTYRKNIRDQFLVRIDNYKKDHDLEIISQGALPLISHRKEKINATDYSITLNGPLRPEQRKQLSIIGKYKGIKSKTKIYNLQHPRLHAVKIDLGFNLTGGGGDLFRYPADTIGARIGNLNLPIVNFFLMKGGIFLTHQNRGHYRTATIFESGVLFPLGRANKLLNLSGMISLKYRLHSIHHPLGIQTAIHVMAINQRNENIPSSIYWGLSPGFYVDKFNLEIDLINFFYDFKNNNFILGGSIRYDITSIFSSKKFFKGL